MTFFSRAVERGHGYSVRAYAVTLVILITIPSLVISWLLADHLAKSARTQFEQNTQQTAREIATVLDGELLGMKNLLKTLATSHALQIDDLEAFYRNAVVVSQRLDVHIAVHDPYRRLQLVNTASPWGTQLEAMNSSLNGDDHETIRALQPTVSNIIARPLIKSHTVIVQVPVIRNGTVVYLLSIELTADYIRSLLTRLSLREGTRAAVIDGNGVFITRFNRHDEFVGKAASPDFIQHIIGTGGTWTSSNTEGVAILSAFHRLQESNWFAVSAVLQSVVDAPRVKALTILGSANGAMLAVALIAAYGFGSRLSHAIGSLVDAGAALSRTEVVHPIESPLLEANLASKELAAASHVIRRTEENSRFAVDAAGLGTWNWNIVENELWWSDRLREILGVPATTAPSHTTYIDRIHPSDRHIVEENRRRCLSGQSRFEIEYRVVGLNDHALRWVNSKGRVDCDKSGKPILMQGIVQDITRQKQAQRERDGLLRRLLIAEEQERLRLARELHDQTGQSITVALLELKGIEAFVNEKGSDRVGRLRADLEEMGRGLHRIAWELRPTSLDDLGLERTLANYLSDWSERSGIQADFHCPAGDLDHLPDDVPTNIYRIVQEALTNVVKHAASATFVSVVIERDEYLLRLTIEDDGCGFDVQSIVAHAAENVRSGHLGFAGILERLTLIGGSLEIESSPGLGATIFIRIELDRKEVPT